MKRILIRIAVIIAVVSFLMTASGAAAIAYASRNIDFDLDEELFEKAKEDKTVYYYAYSSDGELIEVYKSAKETVREWVPFDRAGEYIKQGFISMEDREFYEHCGVNIKRTLAAPVNHVLKLRSSFGASTITQQVIKNISGDNEVSIGRKIKEIFRALHLERRYSKDDIFEVYLNVVPMTGNVYGISAAAEIYFGKEPSELTLSEAATLVGITNAPAKYNPYTKPEACRDKRNRVLYAMYDVGYIERDEYERAVNEPLKLSFKGSLIRELFTFSNDLFAVVVTAFSANTVRHFHFVTLRAFYHARYSQFPVSAARIATCFGHFSLRYCHFSIHLLSAIK